MKFDRVKKIWYNISINEKKEDFAMAKIAFSKLGIKLNTDVKILPWNEQDIEVRQYLPMEEKADLVARVINNSLDDNGYYNPLKVKVFLALETMYLYTNLTFTTKMKEDGLKLYDLLIGSELFSKVIELIPAQEWNDLQKTVWDTIANIYEYKNSAMGILEAISEDYSNLSLDANALTDTLLNPEALATLKELAPLAQ